MNVSLAVWRFWSSFTGISYICSQLGDQSSDRGVSVWGVRRHSSGDPRHGHCSAGHLFHPGGGSRVSAWEDETSFLGSSYFLGAGRSIRCESIMSVKMQSLWFDEMNLYLSHDQAECSWLVVQIEDFGIDDWLTELPVSVRFDLICIIYIIQKDLVVCLFVCFFRFEFLTKTIIKKKHMKHNSFEYWY